MSPSLPATAPAAKPERVQTHTICRECHLSCSLIVDMEGGRLVKAYGDKNNPVSRGFSCIRGREQGKYANLPSRLTHSLKRSESGEFHSIASDRAAKEVAVRLSAIIAEHGPRSVAAYAGTWCVLNTLTNTLVTAIMEAIGSPMYFTPQPIDQPGKPIAFALHGRWLGSVRRASDDCDVMLLFGTNPVNSANGAFGTSPSYNLNAAKKRGMYLIVVDPRRSETAQHADLFLQPRPSEDAVILAGIIRVILHEGLGDIEFVAAEADGLEALRAAVEPFDPAYVAARAEIAVDDLVAAARTFAMARRATVNCGTGTNMSGHSSLSEYLALVLMTLCGQWPRAGERIGNPGVLFKFPEQFAASPGPTPALFGAKMRVHGLSNSAAGMPTAALPDEILTGGEGQVKALFVIGGNPMVAFPDQEKTFRAMQALDLLVCMDPHLSSTARLADYVIAPKTHLEISAFAAWPEQTLSSDRLVGYQIPYQQYSPALVDPPEGADVIEEFEFLYRMAQAMELKLTLKSSAILTGDAAEIAAHATPLDMSRDLTADELWACIFRGSPVPLEEVKRQARGGHVFDVPQKRVRPKPVGWQGRFDIGNGEMMDELRAMAQQDFRAGRNPRPFRLLSRRLKDIYNSNWHEHGPLKRKWSYNPAFMHPDDISDRGLTDGQVVRIESDKSFILGVVQPDPEVKRGCISMTHGWGNNPGEPDEPLTRGSTTSRLCDNTMGDRYSWIPRMSAIPVSIRPFDEQDTRPRSC